VHRTDIKSSQAAQVIDFFAMTAAAQARFVACTRRKATPNPLLADRTDAPGSIRGWLMLAPIALAGMVGLGAVDFGELTLGKQNQAEAFLAGYAVLGAFLCFCIFSAIRIAVVRGKLPFGPGVYVFPVDLVDARTSHLGLVPMSELKEATVREGARGEREAVLAFQDGSTFTLPLSKTDDMVIEELNQMRAGVQRVVDSNDIGMLEQLDCFYEERVAEGWKALRPSGKSTPFRRRLPGLAVVVPALALLVGALVGRGVWSLRNDTSDRAGLKTALGTHSYHLIDAYVEGGGRLGDEGDTARFEAAKDQGDPGLTRQTLEHYMHHGRLHTDEADDLYFASVKTEASLTAWKTYLDNGKRHLGEADEGLLEAVKKEGTPEAFDLYLAVGSKHVDEVRRTLKPLAELEVAKRGRSPAALRKFAAEHKDPEVQSAALAALRARFDTVQHAFDARFEKKTAVVELMDRLLDGAASGKVLALRLRQFPSADLADADHDLVRTDGPRAVPALGYFSAKSDTTRQNAIAHETLAAFADVFGGDVIDVDSSEGAVAEGQPVLEVGCEFAPDGHYVFKLEKGAFIAMGATCDAVLKVPGEHAAAPLRFRTKFVADRFRFTGAAVANNVYEGMMDPLPELIASRLRRLILPDGR
jgi:hypothetical protein